MKRPLGRLYVRRILNSGTFLAPVDPGLDKCIKKQTNDIEKILSYTIFGYKTIIGLDQRLKKFRLVAQFRVATCQTNFI